MVSSRAAVRVVYWVPKTSDASGLATHDRAARVSGSCELRGTVLIEVDGTVSDAAALVVLDAQRNIEAVDDRDWSPDEWAWTFVHA